MTDAHRSRGFSSSLRKAGVSCWYARSASSRAKLARTPSSPTLAWLEPRRCGSGLGTRHGRSSATERTGVREARSLSLSMPRATQPACAPPRGRKHSTPRRPHERDPAEQEMRGSATPAVAARARFADSPANDQPIPPSRRVRPTTSGGAAQMSGSSCITSGDGGNRTRVRDRVKVASTSVSGALISPQNRLAGGVF